MLEMGAWFAVLSDLGPAVRQYADLLCAHIDHWLDGNHQSFFQAEVGTARGTPGDKIRHLRIFVHLPSDAVPYKILDHGKFMLLDALFHLHGYFAPARALAHQFNGQEKHVLGYVQK